MKRRAKFYLKKKSKKINYEENKRFLEEYSRDFIDRLSEKYSEKVWGAVVKQLNAGIGAKK